MIKTDQLFIAGIFCCNTVTYTDRRDPEHFCPGYIQDPCINGCCRKKKICVIAVYTEIFFDLVNGHLGKLIIKNMHRFCIYMAFPTLYAQTAHKIQNIISNTDEIRDLAVS